MKANSLGDLLRNQAGAHIDKPALLTRCKAGFEPVSYSELARKVREFAGALMSLGIRRGDKVAILSENCVEWALTDWACSSIGAVGVPVYPSLPADQAQYIVCDSESSLVVCGGAEQQKKVAPLSSVRTILLSELTELSAKSDLSEEDWDKEIDATTREDLFTIIYTSGTTGRPKGAMLSHGAALHVCESAVQKLPLLESDTFLSFLPMSHVYERIAGQILPIQMGATIAYAKNLASLAGDMQKVKPTIMLCVPRFLEAFQNKVVESLEKQGGIKKKLFDLAMAQGIKRARGEFAPLAPLLDKLVMSKIRDRVGGRLRFFVSGGAALPRHVAEFLMATRLGVLQGFGLTETAGGTCINHPDRNKYWTVGEPLDMDIRIAEDGEILVKGPALMTGYYNLPEETAEAIDADGWFHTGDIGEFEGSSLKITDRKKDLIVLGNGKNVAPQPIENRLKESPFIAETIVLGDGMDSCAALVVPNFEAVRKELGLPESVELSGSEEARKLIKREIDKTNKTLAPFEMVKQHA
ncbi:MAG TPA: long-chain fatty acid--CoA ligase, partial [Fimbriimonas sp.]|nr:long-chain fatty acid--CoA ligase [Fimbriimonas sp.]